MGRSERLPYRIRLYVLYLPWQVGSLAPYSYASALLVLYHCFAFCQLKILVSMALFFHDNLDLTSTARDRLMIQKEQHVKIAYLSIVSPVIEKERLYILILHPSPPLPSPPLLYQFSIDSSLHQIFTPSNFTHIPTFLRLSKIPSHPTWTSHN